MSITHVYTAQVDARQHVFEPLQPMVPGGLGRTGTALAASAYTRDQFDQAAREAYERGLAEGKQLVDQELLRVVHAMSETVKRAMVEGHMDAVAEADWERFMASVEKREQERGK